MPKYLFAFLLVPLIFVGCSTNNVTVDNSLQKYFDSAGVKGTFGLFDNGQGRFTIYDLARFRDSGFAPGATLDILGSLIALQSGAALNDTSVIFTSILHPGTFRTLKDIFQGTAGPQGTVGLVSKIGKDSLKKWVDSLRYGNRDLNGFDSLEIDKHLRITADEQLGLIKKLYFDQLPFFQHTQQSVREMFVKESNSNYLIAYKTSKTMTREGKINAWIMGWEEENKHPYFFVLNFETRDWGMDVPTVGLQLVKKTLAPMGFFAGKK
ncbi:MAG TPA: penicillin-binding transpeptidase domain-containing protein [Puia sp.]|nr:penicillin-binding transpeptidase domain-containing protein [Puia sp.]